MSRFREQLVLLVGQSMRAEWADKERLISPLLFSITVLLLFSFALGESDRDILQKVYVAEAYLTGFFALQITYARMFEPDQQDRVFDLLRSYPLSSMAWFLGKYIQVLVLGSMIMFPTMFLAAFLNQTSSVTLLSSGCFVVAGLALCGMASLGVLLSSMTLKAGSKQILYPLLYFPLTTPVLLAAVQASLTILKNGSLDDDAMQWVYLLLSFDVIYFTLGILLYGELVEAKLEE